MKILRKLQDWLNNKYPTIKYHVGTDMLVCFRKSGPDKENFNGKFPWITETCIQGISYSRTINRNRKKGEPKDGTAGSIIFTFFGEPPSLYKSLSDGEEVDIKIIVRNENGEYTQAMIEGAILYTEGSGFSIDDTSYEIQVTYFAKRFQFMSC